MLFLLELDFQVVGIVCLFVCLFQCEKTSFLSVEEGCLLICVPSFLCPFVFQWLLDSQSLVNLPWEVSVTHIVLLVFVFNYLNVFRNCSDHHVFPLFNFSRAQWTNSRSTKSIFYPHQQWNEILVSFFLWTSLLFFF